MNEARKHHEKVEHRREALRILRTGRELTKWEWEQRFRGSRLAPTILMLRTAHGFLIEGHGTVTAPYVMPDPLQLPGLVEVTDPIKQGYYDTDHWHQLRQRRRNMDNDACVHCGYDDELQVHHAIYNLFAERLSDLITVCEECHEKIHKQSYLKFPSGISIQHANLIGVRYEFADWLLPSVRKHCEFGGMAGPVAKIEVDKQP